MEEIHLPQDLLMGTACASVLCEGGNKNTNWYKWSEEGKVRDGSSVLRGTDHWNKYPEDISLMKKMGMNSCNMSIEWSRIFLERKKIDKEAIKHYRNEISMLLENGITPIITLHHFSNPQWFDDMGGWAADSADIIFLEFVQVVIENFGDLIQDWITFNDANIYLISAYLWGWFPPGDCNLKVMLKSMKNIVKAHIESYKKIHKIRKEKNFKGNTNVGFALHFRKYTPIKNNVLNRWATKLASSFAQGMITEALTTGKFTFFIGNGNYPLGRGKYYDFIGVNHWTRSFVKFKFNIKNLFFEFQNSNGEKYTGAMEPYPAGIFEISKELFDKYKAPIYIMQNGLKETVDHKRGQIICENLKYTERLIKEGVPVKGFYVWSLTDLFETMEGEKGKLGLIEINYETQERIIKPSGYFYGDACRNKGVTKEMLEKYFGSKI
ncbi:glycoside hydrolase family 1 protein [Anaeromicropila populeti]|uniref:Glycosyl hydrolase family 1 n=1 Tax=Anaeromicropila populeti TaxID=37658 RepID=A0A1I6J016_9FIRM|nr:family 1 glycosylhydrolase [Anaeromicropila populeti]SFR72289.1 glycosyl hydrolase family 1 [Anaeromicropila populeti]